jgi:hypothetical protein
MTAITKGSIFFPNNMKFLGIHSKHQELALLHVHTLYPILNIFLSVVPFSHYLLASVLLLLPSPGACQSYDLASQLQHLSLIFHHSSVNDRAPLWEFQTKQKGLKNTINNPDYQVIPVSTVYGTMVPSYTGTINTQAH